MTSQLKIAKQSLINKHKLYRNSSKTVTNFFPYPQINQCVHVISNCEIVKNDNQENILNNNNNSLTLPNNFRLQTKITPIYTKNHGYPRLVQEFQFFVNDAIIKYTNVTTSMPDRKDDAFMCQMANLTHQNHMNDYYFDLGNQPKPEEGKIIEEEEERINTHLTATNMQKNSISTISSEQHHRFELPYEKSSCCFKHQANKKHPYGQQQSSCCVFAQAPKKADGQIHREGSLSGISLSFPPIPEHSSDLQNADDMPKSKNIESIDNDNKINNHEKWRGERSIPDNKEEKKEIFKVVKKRICKYDRKINGCCAAGETKLGCKVN